MCRDEAGEPADRMDQQPVDVVSGQPRVIDGVAGDPAQQVEHGHVATVASRGPLGHADDGRSSPERDQMAPASWYRAGISMFQKRAAFRPSTLARCSSVRSLIVRSMAAAEWGQVPSWWG